LKLLVYNISVTEVALEKILNKLEKNQEAITKCLKGYNTGEKIGANILKKRCLRIVSYKDI
jgi:hypothetical protein